MAKERLTEERKQQIEELYSSLHRHNFYSVLNVGRTAERGDIRKAYFAISKLCHPDNYADKDLGPHKLYMEKIFQACSKAYDVLSSASKRERYDAYMEKKQATAQYATDVYEQQASLHRVIEDAAEAARVQELDQVRTSPPPPVQMDDEQPPFYPPPEASSVPTTTPVPGTTPIPRTTPMPSSSSVPPARMDPQSREMHEARRRAWTRDSARRRLLRSLGGTRPSDPAAARSRDWLAEAAKAREEGKTLPAINALKMAISLDPENVDAKQMLAEIMGMAAGELGQRYYDQALSELEFGEVQLAQASIEKAVNLCPSNATYVALGAKILLESDSDLHKAYEYAQRVVLAEPGRAAHQLLLAKILLKAGLQARARSALIKALELDPDLKEARSLLGGR